MSEEIGGRDQEQARAREGRPSASAMNDLENAIADLAADGDYVVTILVEALAAQHVVSISSLSDSLNVLVHAGVLTEDEPRAIIRQWARGNLLADVVSSFLASYHSSLSLEHTARYLGTSEGAVLNDARARRLYSIELGGRVRFPMWQFAQWDGPKVVPELQRLVDAFDGLSWIAVAGYMATPQEGLTARGRLTPVEWLRQGYDLEVLLSAIRGRMV